MTSEAGRAAAKTDDPSPLLVLRSAETFFAAADRQQQWLKDSDTAWTFLEAMPIYFLYGQAIELMLKACLRSQGVSSTELERAYRHDLLKLYEECRGYLGFLGRHYLTMLRFLAGHFSLAKWHIRFRYLEDFREPFPTFEAVSAFGRLLLEAVRPLCAGANPLDLLARVTPDEAPNKSSLW